MATEDSDSFGVATSLAASRAAVACRSVAAGARQIIAIQRLSVVFLDAPLKQDPIAGEWLARDAERWLEPVGELRRK
ncbi:hypothetical protein [Dechloromonas hortensis]|uniref:hypothetical protein n=1 Tax=Dechloromonas hortensis TaxID=337779 RepID=UPI001292101E|nr:hypothetical protein [Dechloromonas hortensis]